MAWHLRGHLTESCSCNMFCPCWFGVQELMIMDQGWCAGAIAFRVNDGQSDGVDLSGRTVVIAVDFPGPTLFDGNATARLYIDDGATPEQLQHLEPIFHGEREGPMAIIAGLTSKWLPTMTASIDAAEEGDDITVTVGGAGAVRSRALRDPDGHGFTLQGGGFLTGLGMETAELAPTNTEWSDGEMPRSFTTKSGARGAAAWSG